MWKLKIRKLKVGHNEVGAAFGSASQLAPWKPGG